MLKLSTMCVSTPWLGGAPRPFKTLVLASQVPYSLSCWDQGIAPGWRLHLCPREQVSRIQTCTIRTP